MVNKYAYRKNKKEGFKLKKIKYIIFLILLMSIFLFVSATTYANTVSKDLSENFFRLHINVSLHII